MREESSIFENLECMRKEKCFMTGSFFGGVGGDRHLQKNINICQLLLKQNITNWVLQMYHAICLTYRNGSLYNDGLKTGISFPF